MVPFMAEHTQTNFHSDGEWTIETDNESDDSGEQSNESGDSGEESSDGWNDSQ